MDKLIIKLENIDENIIFKKVKKVRGIIFNYENKLLITKYAGIYMLPGGKVDDKETELFSLSRELKEELGISINENNIEPFLNIYNYAYQYVERNGSITNKLFDTNYYIINGIDDINISNRNLTENEKNGNFEILFINVEDIEYLLKSNNILNERKKYFDEELRTVINFYLTQKKEVKKLMYK